MRFNRFVFLNRPVLSLETHLGVTASPQAPFPADFVTLPVFGKSPPLRLTPSRSRGRACSLLQHRLRRAMHSRHAQATRPPFGRASLSGRTVGEVGHPKLVGTTRLELTVDPIERPFGAFLSDCGPALTPTHHALQAQRVHQPLDRAARDHDVLAAELPPHLACPVDTEVLHVNAANLRPQRLVAAQPPRSSLGIDLPALVLVVLRGGDRQLGADRLDPVNRLDVTRGIGRSRMTGDRPEARMRFLSRQRR